MKKIIIYITTIFLLISIVSAFNLNFWRTSQLEEEFDGYIYEPTNDQYEVGGCGSGTVLDKRFEICWQADGNNFTGNHTDAINHCDGLNLGDSSERKWRLPNIQEFQSLIPDPCVNCGTGFISSLNGFHTFGNVRYWTNTISASDTTRANTALLSTGSVSSTFANDVRTVSNRAVCVADYHELFPFKIDGCGPDTVLDSLTNTCFMRNWHLAGSMNWTDALNYCRNLVHCNDGSYIENNGNCDSNGGLKNDDWDLPVREELLRAVDYNSVGGTGNPMIVGGNNNIFNNVQSASYWSSSRRTASFAWFVRLVDGGVSNSDITSLYRVVCVSRN